MVFIESPDVMPQPVQQESIVLAAASNSASSVRRMTYGVCELVYATDEISENQDSSVNELHPTTYMDKFLSPKLQKALNMPAGAAPAINDVWYEHWSSSFKISLLKAPMYGKFVNMSNDPYSQYLPVRDYIGKDTVDLLVEGFDDKDRPVALTLKYYINVLPEKELHKIVDEGKSAKLQEKLCGKNESYWHTHDSWQISERLNSRMSFNTHTTSYGSEL